MYAIKEIVPSTQLEGINLFTNLYVLSIVLLIVGVPSFIYGFYRFIKDNSIDKSFKLESKILNIIEQDLRFIELKNKTLEYNERVEKYNKEHNEKLLSIKHRDITDIVRQAENPRFYEETYKSTKN